MRHSISYFFAIAVATALASTHAKARTSRSIGEDNTATLSSHNKGSHKRPKAHTNVSYNYAPAQTDVERPLMKGAVQTKANQGQGTSTAYENDFAAVPIDITFGMNTPLTSNKDSGAPKKTNTSKPKHATPGGMNVKSVGADTLHKAIAADKLKKKLREDEKKRMLLEQLAKQDKTNPVDEVVLDLIAVSEKND